MRILIVEDDFMIAELLRRGLGDQHYVVDIASDGDEGLDLALSNDYDLMILDVMLPRRDGVSVCKELRQRQITTPILMLTARDAVPDRVRGLEAGADDYLP